MTTGTPLTMVTGKSTYPTGPVDYLVKVLVIGDSGAVKPLLAEDDGKDQDDHMWMMPTTTKRSSRYMELNGKHFKLEIFVDGQFPAKDGSHGQFSFHAPNCGHAKKRIAPRPVPPALFWNVAGIVLVYDVGNKESFQRMRQYVDQVQSQARQEVTKMLVGIQSDNLPRQVSREQGLELANELGMRYMEVSDSATLDAEVDDVWYAMIRHINKGMIIAEREEHKVMASQGFRDAMTARTLAAFLTGCVFMWAVIRAWPCLSVCLDCLKETF